MLGPGVGLVDLVEAARDRALADDDIPRWHEEAGWDDEQVDACLVALRVIADEACRLALGGQFRWAAKVALPHDLYIPQAFWDAVYLLNQCPAWQGFIDAVELAGRIDTFLGVLESDRRTAPLAGDCRRELDLLGVLADLCEDVGLTRAAAEARNFHSLASAAWRG